MEYTINLKEMKAQPTLTMRSVQPVGKLPELFAKAFGGVMAYLQELGKSPNGIPFGAYFNLDMQALDVEAGFPVAERLSGKGEIIASEIPAGLYLCTIHEGAYDSMQPAYQALTQWAEDHAYITSGTVFEFYLNDPGEADGVIPLTEIRFPVKKVQHN